MVAITPQLRSVKSFACFSFSVAIDRASSNQRACARTSGSDEGFERVSASE
jgi:hypothetical protein